jgi:hypothetical protein
VRDLGLREISRKNAEERPHPAILVPPLKDSFKLTHEMRVNFRPRGRRFPMVLFRSVFAEHSRSESFPFCIGSLLLPAGKL